MTNIPGISKDKAIIGGIISGNFDIFYMQTYPKIFTY